MQHSNTSHNGWPYSSISEMLLRCGLRMYDVLPEYPLLYREALGSDLPIPPPHIDVVSYLEWLLSSEITHTDITAEVTAFFSTPSGLQFWTCSVPPDDVTPAAVAMAVLVGIELSFEELQTRRIERAAYILIRCPELLIGSLYEADAPDCNSDTMAQDFVRLVASRSARTINHPAWRRVRR